jgi:hypothetical protein
MPGLAKAATHQSPSGCRFTTRVLLLTMNRPAGFSAAAAANTARAQSERAADRQRLVAVALEPFLNVDSVVRDFVFDGNLIPM